MNVAVTEHAIDRYCERIANLPREQIRGMILGHGRAIETAARFGAHTVRLGTGVKLVITGRPCSVGKDGTARQGVVRVVTVLAREMINKADCPRGGVVLCGRCGLRTGHPIARSCTRADCGLACYQDAPVERGGRPSKGRPS